MSKKQKLKDYRKLLDDVNDHLLHNFLPPIDFTIDMTQPDDITRELALFVKSVIENMSEAIAINTERIEQGKFQEYLDSLEEN